MANKLSKKGRNPGAVDSWLDSLGLYRKNVAYDETCLFRAVSEQLFNCQIYHEKVRKECITYGRYNFDEFSHLVSSEDDWHEHLDLLEKHMAVCGTLEIHIISKIYERDVIIFDAVRQHIYDLTRRNLPNSLLLCLMDKDHYDVVYNREHIVTAGFCQSIIYKILYEEVFQIPNVDEIVNVMLYNKNTGMLAQLDVKKNLLDEVNNNDLEVAPLEDEIPGNVTPVSNNIAPFPFKVAKALDPTIYRNIEYDSWGEVRREMRLGEWYYGDDKLILGTRCIYNDDNTNEKLECYIQRILEDQNKCMVYLTKLAQYKTVDYTDLSPENDAKPWPLPYRFSKNLVIVASPQPPTEKFSKNMKKRNKDKRRTKSCSESSAISNAAGTSEPVENVSAYVGVPLQMQSPNDNVHHHQEVSTETQTEPCPVETVIMTPDIQATPNRYHPQWHPYLPPTPDPFVWPQTPTTPQNMFSYNLKPMVASAPVTPDVVPYHDPNFPYFYNYQVEPYHTYNHWSPQTSPPSQKMDHEKSTDEGNKASMLQPDPAHYYTQNEGYETQMPVTSQTEKQLTLCTTLTPQSTPVEVFSPTMMPIPSCTPILYAPAPTEVTEVIIPSTPMMYTPSVDIQYVSPGPYVYPPTPPAAWYPAGVNAQGFIFPSRPQ